MIEKPPHDFPAGGAFDMMVRGLCHRTTDVQRVAASAFWGIPNGFPRGWRGEFSAPGSPRKMIPKDYPRPKKQIA
jgi:hypothetical protein